MDFEQNTTTQNMPNTNQNTQSNGMAAASMVLGIIAVATFPCIYIALICGALGLLLGLLSRGGEMAFSTQGKAGLALSGIGLFATLAIYTGTLVFIFTQYGGIEAFLSEYETLYQSMGLIQ